MSRLSQRFFSCLLPRAGKGGDSVGGGSYSADMSIEWVGLFVIAGALVASAWIYARSRHPVVGLSDPSLPIALRFDKAASDIAALSVALEERRRSDERSQAVLLHLERVLSGSYSKGKMGENVLREQLDALPPEMLVRDFTIGGRVCEFGLRLSDGKILPIDSKWPALQLVDQLSSEDDSVRCEAIRRVDKALMARLPEVAGYIDPALTTSMAVVAVPDPVYASCRKAHAAAAGLRLTIVPYSSAVPILLTIWHLHRSTARDVDARQLAARLQEITICLSEMSDRIEGHLARGLKQANNAAAELRALVGATQSALSAIDPPEREESPDLRVEAV